jgi:hypothetical protein
MKPSEHQGKPVGQMKAARQPEQAILQDQKVVLSSHNGKNKHHEQLVRKNHRHSP